MSYVVRANLASDVDLYVQKGSTRRWTADIRNAKKFKNEWSACKWMRCNRLTYSVYFYDIIECHH